jgi:hypothetical protein
VDGRFALPPRLRDPRGRNDELGTIDAGTARLRLDNSDRRFEPEYSGLFTSARTLTLAGNEITDATRAAAAALGTGAAGQMIDGLSSDASFGIRRAANNLFRYGQCDSLGGGAGADWRVTSSGVTPAIDATVAAPFSPQSVKVTTDGTIASQAIAPKSAAGQAAAAGVLAAVSAYFKGVAGQQYVVQSRWNNTDATTTDGAATIVTATGIWQLIKPATVAVAAGKTGDSVGIRIGINGTRAESFWVAHPMLEKGTQTEVGAPYVATSGGATATHGIGRVQAPAALLDATQGWAAARVRMGYGSTQITVTNPTVFSWSDGTANNTLRLSLLIGGWRLRRNSGGSAQFVDTTIAWNAGDVLTFVVAWTATQIKISVTNGGPAAPFVTAAAPLVPTGLAATFDIGRDVTLAPIDGDIFWFAAGTGTLTDADAAAFHALGNSTGLVLQDFCPNQPAPQTAPQAPTFVWNADDAGYGTLAPYYPNVDVLRPIRISATWNGTTYRLFTGFVERWPPARRSTTGAYVDVEAVDAFELLKQATLSSAITFGGFKSGLTIGGVLDVLGWPVALRNLDTGQSVIAATAGDGDALSYMQAVADSELGYVFVNGAGLITFHDRYHRLKAPATTPKFTAGSNTAAGEIPYLDTVLSFDKDGIANDWTISDNSSNSANKQDASSITRYLRRSRSRSTLLATVAELALQASYLLGRYKNPAVRVRDISFRGDRLTFAALLALELGDRITVNVLVRPAAAPSRRTATWSRSGSRSRRAQVGDRAPALTGRADNGVGC